MKKKPVREQIGKILQEEDCDIYFIHKAVREVIATFGSGDETLIYKVKPYKTSRIADAIIRTVKNKNKSLPLT